MTRKRLSDTDAVKVSEVTGDADQFMVADGWVWQDDLLGIDGAETAADHDIMRHFKQGDTVSFFLRPSCIDGRCLWASCQS